MFISVDLWSAPLVGPLMVCCVTAGQTGELGPALQRSTLTPSMQRLQREGCIIGGSALLQVAAEEKEAGVSHQEGGMRPEGIRMSLRVTRTNLLCCQGCTGQVLD